MSTHLFSPWPSFTKDEASAIERVLLSNAVNYWTGNECSAFEDEFSTWTGTRHAIAVSNGTVALEIALKALGISVGDEVIVTPRTFFATVASIVNSGAIPIFADVDTESGNITSHTIKTVISKRTRAIICVHLAGQPCDMDPILELCNTFGLMLIEDCAQAHGARYKGHSVGSIGHIGTWSFCQDKIMTTGGEGGMITTNDDFLWRKMWSLKEHGKNWDAVFSKPHPPGFRWLHECFGSNARMTEMQAAIGRIQLRRISTWTSLRQANAKSISNALSPFSSDDGPIHLPRPSCQEYRSKSIYCDTCTEDCAHVYYKLYAFVRPDNLKFGWNRNRIVQEIEAMGVPCFYGSCSEVYLEKAFDATGYRPHKRLPIARLLGETSLMFLVHPTLNKYEIKKTATAIRTILTQSSSRTTSGQ
ncbi:MAG: DegT/DnrJ/EryC1/StrS aminotransferase family protein [Candidatus Sedimenticola endophacoides]